MAPMSKPYPSGSQWQRG